MAFEHELEVISGKVASDHVHMFISYRPTQEISKIMQWLKASVHGYCCNHHFAVTPEASEDAHRPVLHSTAELELILCLQHRRLLSKSLTLQYHNRLYRVQNQGSGYRLRHTHVIICEAFDGTVTLLHQGQVLDYTCWAQGEAPPLADDKEINAILIKPKRNKGIGVHGSRHRIILGAIRYHPITITQTRLLADSIAL